MEEIIKLAKTTELSPLSVEFAEMLDKKDPLYSFREEFNIPNAREVINYSAETKGLANAEDYTKEIDVEKECAYFVGNLIGLQPKKVSNF